MRFGSAVGAHEEEYGKPISDICAALIIADKVDAYKARVRAHKYDTNDIHDRVNFSIKNTSVAVDKEKRLISYAFTMDHTSSILEFMEIYLSRMRMCEESARYLECKFVINVNGINVNRIEEHD